MNVFDKLTLFLFFLQMKGSCTISAVIILGIISLSSANRIQARLPSCVTYCGNYAKHCVDCPLESCDTDDHDCIFYECMASMRCHIYQKREKSDALVGQSEDQKMYTMNTS